MMSGRQVQPVLKAKVHETWRHHSCTGHLGSIVQRKCQVPDVSRLRMQGRERKQLADGLKPLLRKKEKGKTSTYVS